MEEKEVLEEFTIKNLIEHYLSQYSRNKSLKFGYEHYIFAFVEKDK